MVGEAAKKQLYDAARNGDVAKFQELLQEDPYLLDEVSFASSKNLLHIATTHEQVGVVEEVLKINPELALELDSKKSSPLHIAAAKGNVKIAKKLIELAPETCWWRDSHDMNPVHIAAMKGHVMVLEELLRRDHLPAMERLHRGQTVLHLCVKHRHLRALEFLAGKLGELVCAKDDDGETLLHLAVRCNQVKVLRYLEVGHKIERQTLNSMGKTARQILHKTPTTISDYLEMEKILTRLSNQSILEILPKLSDMAMVVVVLIATMAFQAAVSPPGGVWQDNTSSKDNTSSHKAGEAVMASTHPNMYKHFVHANTTAFISSLITIFLITTRLPSSGIYFLIATVCVMWVSMASIAVSYGASLMVITPSTGKHDSPRRVITIVVVVSVACTGSIIAYNYIRLYLSRKRQIMWRQQHRTTGSLFIYILKGWWECFADPIHQFVSNILS